MIHYMDENLSPSCIIRTAMPEHKKAPNKWKKLFHELRSESSRERKSSSGRVRKENKFFYQIIWNIYCARFIHFLMYNVIRKVLIRVLLLCRIDNGWKRRKNEASERKLVNFTMRNDSSPYLADKINLTEKSETKTCTYEKTRQEVELFRVQTSLIRRLH